MERRGIFLPAAGLACALGLILWAVSDSWRGLYRAPFVSGWVLVVALSAVGFSWWSPRLDVQNLARRTRTHLGLGALLLVLYAVHVDFGLPRGWIETALFVLFAALLGSTALGGWAVLSGRSAPDSRGLARWLHVHVALVFSLLTLSLFHGLCVHCHGLLAHLFLSGRLD